MNGSRSVRALILTLIGYGGARTLVVWAPAWWPVAIQTAIETAMPAARAATPRPERVAMGRPPGSPLRPMKVGMIHRSPPASPPTRGSGSDRASESAAPSNPTLASDAYDPIPAPIPPTNAIAPAARSPTTSRWSGYAYLFDRANTAPNPLAPSGQIGGAQAAARLAYRLDALGHLAIAARIATPLGDTAQAEAAAGIDLLPLPGLRLSVERRVALGSRGRDAWSAYAAAGLFRTVAPHVELDGYAQAGLVGGHARDPFADAALRIVHRTALGRAADLRLGAGAWGAAQPGAARLDLGPRVAVTLRTARLPLTLAVEGRLRIAGHARPGNGAALTLATDF